MDAYNYYIWCKLFEVILLPEALLMKLLLIKKELRTWAISWLTVLGHIMISIIYIFCVLYPFLYIRWVD